MRPLMAVLTRDVILDEIDAGRVVVDPFERDQVGVSSIDLTLGNEIRVIEPSGRAIEISEDTDYRDHTRVAALDDPYLLPPGVTIHGITNPNRIAERQAFALAERQPERPPHAVAHGAAHRVVHAGRGGRGPLEAQPRSAHWPSL